MWRNRCDVPPTQREDSPNRPGDHVGRDTALPHTKKNHKLVLVFLINLHLIVPYNYKKEKKKWEKVFKSTLIIRFYFPNGSRAMKYYNNVCTSQLNTNSIFFLFTSIYSTFLTLQITICNRLQPKNKRKRNLSI